ncbi:MAG: hypothetical protein OEO21_11410, partial [Candidatus Krumholzibacteria bacterium]|nr:hypothetical protein [Candidatus Krumholzibacteria bacterium]
MRRSGLLALIVMAALLFGGATGGARAERMEVPGYAVTVHYEPRHVRVGRRVAVVSADALP